MLLPILFFVFSALLSVQGRSPEVEGFPRVARSPLGASVSVPLLNNQILNPVVEPKKGYKIYWPTFSAGLNLEAPSAPGEKKPDSEKPEGRLNLWLLMFEIRGCFVNFKLSLV